MIRIFRQNWRNHVFSLTINVFMKVIFCSVFIMMVPSSFVVFSTMLVQYLNAFQPLKLVAFISKYLQARKSIAKFVLPLSQALIKGVSPFVSRMFTN